MILRWIMLAGGLLLAGVGSAKESDGPYISVQKFDHEPINLFYFEDTDTVLVQEGMRGDVHRSNDAGVTWELVTGPDGEMKGNALALFPHPFDKKKAYVIGAKRKHWFTDDCAKTWSEFVVDIELSSYRDPLIFHGNDSEKLLFQGELCRDFDCVERTLYTTDGFRSAPRMLDLDEPRGCAWAVSHPLFGDRLAVPKEVTDRIFCVVPGLHSSSMKDNRLLYSDNFFKDGGTEAPLSNGRAVSGVIRAVGVKKYLLAASKTEGTSEHALYVTNDAVQWHRAEFDGHKLEEDAYTVLESTNYSIQIDVKTSKSWNPMGVLFTSNSNGTYFTRNVEHTNRNLRGMVDFEQISGIQGIVLVNTVRNWEDVEKGGSKVDKELVSRISFDDGRHFQPLKTKGHDTLHLHSVTHLSNSGRVFSSPAPGLVMGIGNTGDYLKGYLEGDLYVSDDAGISWLKGPEGAHKYEFGDQGAVIIAILDEGRTDKISYSINHGKKWKSADLPQKIRAKQLTTTPDSTSLKFLLVGSAGKGSDTLHYVLAIDFSKVHKRKCEKNDFERWNARQDENGDPDCLMGYRQFYRRRKADSDCFIDEEFKDPVPELDRCKCTEEDFECDFNFIRGEDGKQCIPARPLSVPEGECKDPEDEFLGSSGFRLIPGNDCERKGGVELDRQIKRPCSDAVKSPVSGEIMVEKTNFAADDFRSYYYLERKVSNHGDDETVIMQTSDQKVYITKDHGKNWKEILAGKKIVRVVPHRYFNDVVYFLTGTEVAYWSIGRGDKIQDFKAPLPPNRLGVETLAFHPQHKDWLIWIGADECGKGGDCHAVAYYSTDRGEEWHLLMRYVRKCEFIGREGRGASDKLVFCEQYEGENPHNRLQLFSSNDWFATKTLKFESILDFATMAEFIIVAARAEDSLKVDASVDGDTFADAEFPPNFHVPVQRAYTLLDSSTHSVFLHVTVNNQEDHEYGTIIKSNSNGTSYVLSLGAVNRNKQGYVDIEKMKGLEGVAIVNRVGNVDEVEKGGKKKLKTMITHSDGARWALLPPPSKDVDGHDYSCSLKNGKPLEQCSLHLHGFTERRDPRDTFSSGSAVGLMMGIGNVGEYLTTKGEADTFITRDGGITWHEVKKGSYMWEYGDQGSIIVIVPEKNPTKILFYSLNEGTKWTEFQFSDVDMKIKDISTVPSDNSMNFLLLGEEFGPGAKAGVATVNLDFSHLKERQRKCVLEEKAPEANDYDFWEPQHPGQDDKCLFGHVARYHRKKPEAECYNGQEPLQEDNIGHHCDCTRQDYECDYNYEPVNDGSCRLVEGLQPPQPEKICMEDPNAFEYFEPTGYRLIPLTTCVDGLQLDHLKSRPCPGKQDEYNRKHPGLSGAGLFFAVVVPIALALGVGYYVFTRWDRKFGSIRLGDTSSGGMRDSLFITVPIAVVAGAVAVVKALPLLATSIWRSASGYARVSSRAGPTSTQRPYASRGAFAARRGDYVGVVDDEDELLGAEEADGDEEDEV